MIAARRKSAIRMLRAYVAQNYLNILSTVLLLLSLFYFVQVQQVRYATLSNHPELFEDGETVTILKVIDGDELRIKNEKGSTRIRLLGVQSFDPTARDLVLAEYGKICVDVLEQDFVGVTARLKISSKGIDGQGRLLGSLFANESKKELAYELLEQGLTIVYTKYDFAKMEEYLKVQEKARSERVGLWTNDRVAARAESMQRLWDQERADR